MSRSGIYHDTAVERAVLGTAICAPERHTVMSIKCEYITHHPYKIILAAMHEMINTGASPDLVSLDNHLSSTGRIDAAGGSAAVSEIIDHASPGAFLHHLKILDRMTRARTLHEELTCISGRLDDGAGVAEVGAEAARAGAAAAKEHEQINDLGDIISQVERWQKGECPGSLITGYQEIDNTYPIGHGELVVIGARPSIGKTALLIALAENISRVGPVYFLSAEMPTEAVSLRRLSAESGVPAADMRRANTLQQEQWDRVMKAANVIKSHRVKLAYSRPGVEQLQADIYREVAENNIVACMIDYIGLIRPPRAERYDLAMGIITKSLCEVAKQTGIVIFVASQLNRDGEKGDGPRRPVLTDLRNSGEIEQDADHVWLLWRAARYEYCAPDVQELSIIIAKNRNGPVGEVQLTINIKTGKIK